ncbi:MAG: class II glutamine amidotransferase [Planctomycetota bacterium]|nr:MAG: class II glutamine amidotransferase [Planctomycetota bacterium]
MCRWLAYSGPSMFLDELILKPEHSLIDQSLAARASTTATNGDGFGVAWYGKRDTPGLYRSIRPAWNDLNLRDLASHIESPLFLAHVRQATEAPVQQSNCHPFRFGAYSFLHNGKVEDFRRLRRSLSLAIAEEFYPCLQGSTDSEILFYLALSFGLRENPLLAMEKMVGLVEAEAREADIADPLYMTAAASNGKALWAFRYTSNGRSPSLYLCRGRAAFQDFHPRCDQIPEEARLVVSEPLFELSGPWEQVPEATALRLTKDQVELHPFRPIAPKVS